MKKRVVYLVCDNPACLHERPEKEVLPGSVTIPRTVMQTKTSFTLKRDLYACSADCAAEAVRAAFGVKVPARKTQAA